MFVKWGLVLTAKGGCKCPMPGRLEVELVSRTRGKLPNDKVIGSVMFICSISPQDGKNKASIRKKWKLILYNQMW